MVLLAPMTSSHACLICFRVALLPHFGYYPRAIRVNFEFRFVKIRMQIARINKHPHNGPFEA